MSRSAPEAYSLIDPGVFYSFQKILEGGGSEKDAYKALATNANHIHRECQRVCVVHDTQEESNTEYATFTSTAASGSPDLIHVFYMDHLLSDADLKVTVHYKTVDNGGGSRCGLKVWLIEPDGTTHTLASVVLDSATWTTYSFTYNDPDDDVADSTDSCLLAVGVYEVHVGADLDLKKVIAESVADTTTTLDKGIRPSGYIPSDTDAYDANSPLSTGHAQQLVDNIQTLREDKTSVFLSYSENMQDTTNPLLNLRSGVTGYRRLLGPIPVALMPGTTLHYALCGWSETAVGTDEYRIYTKAMLEKEGGLDQITSQAFSTTKANTDPDDPDDWTTGTLFTRPSLGGEMVYDEVWIDVTVDNSVGLYGITLWEALD